MGNASVSSDKHHVLRAGRERLLDALPDAVVFASLDGIVLHVNPAFLRIFRCAERPVVGTSMCDLYVDSGDGEDAGAMWQTLSVDNPSVRFDARLHRFDGEVFRAEVVAGLALGEHFEPLGYVAMLRDIEEACSIAEERDGLNRSLKQQARRKDDFLAMLSHELRNPLTPVLAAFELMRSDTLELERRLHCMQVIERQVLMLARIVDDLLDVSRISSGKTELRCVRLDVCDLINRCIDAMRETIDARGHHIEVELSEGAYIEADPVRIGQVLANLLQNAAKYTDPGGRIVVTAFCDGEDVVVRVRDNGIGMEPEVAPKVFDLFEQTDEAKRRASGGLGIGLTVVRGLVELHGGTVQARSDGLGLGSEFEVRLPLAEPPSERDRPSEIRSSQRRLRVLLVDDNVDAAVTLAQLIGLWGHEALIAHEGSTAIELARRERPDVVLLDIGLPGMDGYEVARHLRAASETRDALLVAVTGYSQKSDRERALDAGFQHHLVKPLDTARLVELLADRA